MATPKLLTDEELTINAPQAQSAYIAQPQNPEQAALLNTINNPPAANPILQQIANAPQSMEGPSFGRQVANQLLGEVPLFGQILQQRHAQEFQEQQRGQHLQALAQSASNFPQDQQRVLADLVQQGRPDEAFKTYQKFAEMGVKNTFKSGDSAALREALKARIARIEDPVMRQSFEAIAQTDPKSAMIQVGNFENSQFNQGMRVKSDTRADAQARIAANEGLIKDIKDDPAGKRALDIQKTLIEKNFVPGDENLPSSQFRQKFGFDKKESSNIQLQLQQHLRKKKQGGVFGIGADYPPELKSDPQKLLGDVHTIFASEEALKMQKQNQEFRDNLQKQTDELRKQVTGAGKPAKAKATPEQIRAEIKRRKLAPPKK